MIAAEVKYKKTGVDWIQEVPEQWNIVRLKNIVQINANKLSEQTSKNTLINYIDITNVNSDGDILEVQQLKFKDAPSRARRVLKKNDTIISTVRTYLKAITAIHEDNFIGSTGFAVLTPDLDRLNPDFLYYYVSSKAFVNKVMVNSVGVAYPAITPTTLACLPFILPPIEEQIRIVDILNSESIKITSFIQTKQRFIELLKEQRQSIIDEALDIEAKKIRLKFCVSKVGSGVTPKGGASVYQNSGVTFLRSQNIHNDSLRLDNVAFITDKTHTEMSSSQVKRGDVLLNITGASIGRCYWFHSDEEANVNQHVSIIRPVFEILDSEFLMYQIQSQRIQHLINTVQGASREGLTIHEIKSYPLLVPSTTDEQKSIVEHIKTETRLLDIAISKAEREIELIKEYREAMIAEAVTGKQN